MTPTPTPLRPDADFKVADLSLAEFGRKEIRLAEHEMPGLMAIRREYASAQPLAGARITGSLQMTVQTAVLIETLSELGADVRWASCNIFSMQDHGGRGCRRALGKCGCANRCTCLRLEGRDARRVLVVHGAGTHLARLTDRTWFWTTAGMPPCWFTMGLSVEKAGRGSPTRVRLPPKSSRWFYDCCKRTIAETPIQVVWRSQAGIKGVTEETTTGVHRLYQMLERGELLFPAINVNDAVTKSKFDNKYGCRHSLIDGINRATDTLIGGKTAVVFGYGDVGKGSAESLRGQGARVVVTEVDPICALQAAMDGYQVVRLADVVETADIFITATGNKDVISAADLARMKHQAIVGNIGHFDNEIDIAGLTATPGIRRENIKPQVDLWHFADGHAVIVLSEGRLLNLGNATGHPSFVMSNSFANQTIAQIELFTKTAEYPVGVYTLPKHLDEKVARLHLDALGVRLTELTQEQSDYLGIPVEGPFKPDHYRY